MTQALTGFSEQLAAAGHFQLRRVVERLREGLFDPFGVRLLTAREDQLKAAFDQGGRALAENRDAHLCVCGAYGHGKSHGLTYLRQHALAQGFAVSLINLDPRQTPLHDFRQVYRALVRELVFPDTDASLAKRWERHARAALPEQGEGGTPGAAAHQVLPECMPHVFKAILAALAGRNQALSKRQRATKKHAAFRPREFPWILTNALRGNGVPVVRLRHALKYRQVSFYREHSLTCKGWQPQDQSPGGSARFRPPGTGTGLKKPPMPRPADPPASPLLLLPNTFRAFYGAFAALRPIQHQAITPILQGKDLIVQSATGSGKTEAVLAPCLERLITSDANPAALYIVPTRALALDIHRRFRTILQERLGLGLAIRTGDLKQSGGGSPALLLTTPESLDVLLGSANPDLRGLLARLATVIIDEVHPLVEQYRGHHLRALLHRLERRIGRRLQRIALSATLADPGDVSRFLSCEADTVFLIDSVHREIVPRLVHLRNDEQEVIALLDDLHRQWSYRKILLFANSRARCDKLFGLLNQQGPYRAMTHLHYSNLTTRQRQQVEHDFREHPLALCIATSTLELGIDVGDVDAVVLFEPPDSVAAFLQRLGRANRRRGAIHFWGVCRGERAGEQLLRFLALLRLARRGQVEATRPKHLPSVLSQQVISCLYEKKRLSPAALQDLFASQAGNGAAGAFLERIIASLARKQWLRQSRMKGLYRGGWRYYDALLDCRIWSNFPETEQEYKLTVAGEPVADIPQSVVSQIDPGDKVLLAGKRLRIVGIDTQGDRRVLAEPTRERLDEKEIFWLGPGAHVSLEIARSMREVLKAARTDDNAAEAGLFHRTRALLRTQIAQDRQTVRLDNAIEVRRCANGFYQYRTYLGSVGNLILARAIEAYCQDLEKDVYVLADETGLLCSRSIPFERLSLPLSPDDVTAWIERRFKAVRAMFPLNAFWATLPPELMRLELADFLLDPRLLEVFQRYRKGTSAIVAGDPRALEGLPPEPAEAAGPVPIASPAIPSLLRLEQARFAGRALPRLPPEARYRIRPVSAACLGEYFRHQQCRRWFCFDSLRPEAQPLGDAPLDDACATARRQRGLDFERAVMVDLQPLNEQFHRVRDRDETGALRPLEERLSETREWLRNLAGEPARSGVFYLAAFPSLLATLSGCLASPPDEVHWRLQGHCTGCTFFSFCYRQALQEEDIQFLPGLSDGALQHLRRLGLRDLTGASAWLAATPAPAIAESGFSPEKRQHLQGAIRALQDHTVTLIKSDTALFPANITTWLFVHCLYDPLTRLPRAFGLALGKPSGPLRSFIQVAATEADREQAWRAFSTDVRTQWREAMERGDTPHLFCFGAASRHQFQEWAELMADEPLRRLFKPGPTPFCTDLRQVLRSHFHLPLPGEPTLFGLSRLLASDFEPDPPTPDSLLHDTPVITPLETDDARAFETQLSAALTLLSNLHAWIAPHVRGDWHRPAADDPAGSESDPALPHLRFIEAQRTLRERDFKELQALTLAERVARFRALGPLSFVDTVLDDEGRFVSLLAMAGGAPPEGTKFRQGDFLKLVPAGVKDLQSGQPVILVSYQPQEGVIGLRSRQNRQLVLQKNWRYSLEEDAEDWHTPKLIAVVESVYRSKDPHPVADLLAGRFTFGQPAAWQTWVRGWLAEEGAVAGLNDSQRYALQLPFRHSVSLIQGPPGTGKTLLLGWILIALVRHAQSVGEPLRIVISGLTHQAIDQVLARVASLVNQHRLPEFPARCCKWGRQKPSPADDPAEGASQRLQVETLRDPEALQRALCLIVGATGYGLTTLLPEKKNGVPAKPFDWVIFDEASQVLVPQAMLSLVRGKGNFLFLGDERQLPPVVRSGPAEVEPPEGASSAQGQPPEESVRPSLLTHLLHRYPGHIAMLDVTYRMNASLCAFPSRTWYAERLHPAEANARARLSLQKPLGDDPLDSIIDPEKPVVLVRLDHQGCRQQSPPEADLLARLAHRLIDIYGLAPAQLALISPHRAQNNAIARRLIALSGNSPDALPLIETVERIQGAERDVILFGVTVSDPDSVLGSFLNNPNRFNVAITRARKKLIVVGSDIFFSAIARNGAALHANACFKEFAAFAAKTQSDLSHFSSDF